MAKSANDELPEELKLNLANFADSLETVEQVLQSVTSVPLDDIHKKLPPLDQAKFDLTMAYTFNSLFWMYLNLQGENPKEHGIKNELERIRNYMNKVKEIADRDKAPHIDRRAAKRFILNSLNKPINEKGDSMSTPEESHTTPGSKNRNLEDTPSGSKSSEKRKNSSVANEKPRKKKSK